MARGMILALLAAGMMIGMPLAGASPTPIPGNIQLIASDPCKHVDEGYSDACNDLIAVAEGVCSKIESGSYTASDSVQGMKNSIDLNSRYFEIHIPLVQNAGNLITDTTGPDDKALSSDATPRVFDAMLILWPKQSSDGNVYGAC